MKELKKTHSDFKSGWKIISLTLSAFHLLKQNKKETSTYHLERQCSSAAESLVSVIKEHVSVTWGREKTKHGIWTRDINKRQYYAAKPWKPVKTVKRLEMVRWLETTSLVQLLCSTSGIKGTQKHNDRGSSYNFVIWHSSH